MGHDRDWEREPATYAEPNADGQRVRRKVNGVETWQVYVIGGELLAEYAASRSPSNPQKEYGYRNGQLLITADVSSQSSTQNVVWTNAVGVTVSGNSLTKTGATGWNAGASSTQTIASGDGYMESDCLFAVRLLPGATRECPGRKRDRFRLSVCTNYSSILTALLA